ncbi:MAG: HEAT repeat domain-containing protein [Planctomycetales bacterium]|nr:HEAT repeat domain-containing protein [Planctomycetales bacterium]
MDRRPFLPVAIALAGLPIAAVLLAGGAGAWCGTTPVPTWDPTPTVTNPPVPPSTGRTPGSPGAGPGTTVPFGPTTTFRPAPGSTGDPGATGGPTGPRRPRASALDWRRWWNAERVRLWPHRGGSGSKIATTGGGNGAGPGRFPWESALPAALGGTPAISDRRAAAFAGAYVRDPALLPLMTKLAADPSDDVRDVAVLGMAMCGTGHGETFTVLAAIVEDDTGDVHRRSGSTVALGHLGDPAAVPILTRLLARRDLPVQVRGGSALALGLLGDRAACADLARALRDGRQEDCVRGFAAVGLALLARGRGETPAGSDPAGVLREIAGDPKSAHAPVRQTALLALGRCPPTTENLEALLGALRNEPDPCSRVCAALALGSVGGGDPAAARTARDALIASFQREAPELRAFAALGLGMGRHLEARKTLEKHLAEPGDPEPRAACAIALGLLGDPAATPALLGVARTEKGPGLRTAATEALGLLGGREAADALRQLASEPAAEVRGQALYGLGLAGDSADLGRLAGALGEATALVRQGAVLGLAARGGAPSRDFLLAHAPRESDPEIRSLAIRGAALADSVAPNPVIARSPRVSPWLPLPE